MLSAGRREEEDGYESLLAGVFNRRKEMPSEREQRRQTLRSPSPVLIDLGTEADLKCRDVRYF